MTVQSVKQRFTPIVKNCKDSDQVRHRIREEADVVRGKPESFSIFFPMYNERENITTALDQALAVVPNLGFERFEIIVVDDGSKDGSHEVVREWADRAGLNG